MSSPDQVRQMGEVQVPTHPLVLNGLNIKTTSTKAFLAIKIGFHVDKAQFF